MRIELFDDALLMNGKHRDDLYELSRPCFTVWHGNGVTGTRLFIDVDNYYQDVSCRRRVDAVSLLHDSRSGVRFTFSVLPALVALLMMTTSGFCKRIVHRYYNG